MSTAPPTPASPPALPRDQGNQPRELRIIGHSNLFYWWPVWAVGFVLAGLTFLDGTYMYILPGDTEISRQDVKVFSKDSKDPSKREDARRDILIMPPRDKMHWMKLQDQSNDSSYIRPTKLHGSRNASYGPIFVTVLLLVIIITNVQLRGMWSIMVVITIVMLSVIFYFADVWQTIFDWLGGVDIRINAFGYLFISVPLFIIWVVTVTLFDRQVYMVFSPGQVKVCQEIGDAEKVYSGEGVSIERLKNDFFRHYLLGLGAGDLVIRIPSAKDHIEFLNVLAIGSKVARIEKLIKEKTVVPTSKG